MIMRLFASLVLACTWLLAVQGASAPGAAPPRGMPAVPEQQPAATAPGFPSLVQRPAAPGAASPSDAALLKQYCITCHNNRAQSGGLSLEPLDVASVAGHAETWEKVVRKIRTGMMPPSGAPRPDRAALDTLAGSIESRLDQAHVRGPELRAPSLHRLNRTEYANAIRDLLHLEVNVETLLPGDGSSEGFDNVAEALSVSPTLIQGYVSAPMKISRLAVGDRTLPPSEIRYPAPPALAQGAHIEGLPLGTRGGMVVEHFFPLDAEYEISAGGGRGGFGGADITIDGEPPVVATPPGTRGAPGARGGRGGGRGGRGGGRGGARITVSAGPHTIGAASLDRQRNPGADDIYSDFRTDGRFTVGGGVQGIVITGPFNPTGPGDTPSRRRILTCTPASPADEESCARDIVASLARRAYRGTVSPAEIDTLMSFYAQGRKAGDFETGIQQALARILVAPRFIFRTEAQPAGAEPGRVYRISDVELASRLSFFLWSSIPDDELLELAIDNRLSEPGMVDRQVARMLADPKADALIENFAGQWLYLRELDGIQTEAPNFDDNLRHSFRRETELLFGAIVREDRSVMELLDSDFTYVDERLARHYGIADVRGSYFRKVTLPPDSPRRGLLGHGSVLTVTSVATRTSPVTRGKWILENLFGAPPPEPPPGVETNLEETQTEKPRTVRERLELHRASPTCASCHRIIDPLGFALENFDRVGTWRERDGDNPIDAAGRLADGTEVTGPVELRHALLSRSDAFVSTVIEKLLVYALGRPVEHHDMPLVRAIARRGAANEHRFSSLVLGIVESDAFQFRIAAAADAGTQH